MSDWRAVVSAGSLPSLADLGGPSGVLEEFDDLAELAEFPHVVGLLADSWTEFNDQERAAAREVVLTAATRDDPLQTPDVLELVLMVPAVLKDVGKELATASVRLSRGVRGTVGGAAVEAVVRLTLGGYSRQAVARGLLVEVAEDAGVEHESVDHEWFLRSVCRATGAAIESWSDPNGELVELLEALAVDHEEIVDDAAFELAMAAIAASLQNTNADAAKSSLEEARQWLLRCVRYSDERPDADLFLAAIMATLKFLDGGVVSDAEVDNVRSLASRYLVEGLGEVPGWRQPRADVAAAWWRVVEALARASELDKPQWWTPAGIIAAVADAYSACRTVRCAVSSAGEEPEQVALISPRVTAAFLAEAGRLSFLEQWLRQYGEADAARRREIELVLERLQAVGDAGPPGKARALPQGAEALRGALALNPELSDQVAIVLDNAGLLGPVSTAVREYAAVRTAGHGLYYDQVLQRLNHDVVRCTDYVGGLRAATDLLLEGVLLFVRQRLNAEAGGPSSRTYYLRKLDRTDSDPLEALLAYDLYDFLQARVPGSVHSEVHNVGGGRVDLLYAWPTFSLTIECKRRKRGEGQHRRGGQVAQAEQYQVADVPIGFLVILDLTEKKTLLELEDCAWFEELSPNETRSRAHYVGVFLVQGNRPTPSSQSR